MEKFVKVSDDDVMIDGILYKKIVDEKSVVMIDGILYKKVVDEKSTEEVKEKAPKFTDGEEVYFINTGLSYGTDCDHIGSTAFYSDDEISRYNLSIGNIFKTEEEAKIAVERLKSIAKFNDQADAIKENLNTKLNDISDFVNKSFDKIFKQD